MASLLSFLFLTLCGASLISPALSLTCTSQKITSATDKKPFDSCLDLPSLNSFLHYTYDPANSTLSVAYVAAPAKPDGWVAWAINPTGEGMVGAQALLAFKSKGAYVVKTYNISGYSDIKEGKLSFDAWDLRAETVSGGRLAIFAKVKVPEGAEKVNQVWQAGEKVTGGTPEKHAFAPPNLSSKGELRLVGTAQTPTPAPASAPAPVEGGGKTSAAGETAGNHRGAASVRKVDLGVVLGFSVLLGSLFVF